ncbi:MAG: RNA polymerase sigma factor [Planctomycetaceae bacterium]
MSPGSSDSELLARCRGGEEAAWRLLLERYGALVLSVPRRYGLKAALCDDVFADVCYALLRALPAIRDAKALPQWLIRTAARATWEVARKAKARPPPDLPPLTGAAPPEEILARFEEEQGVRAAVARLPERCQKLLGLLYFTVPAPSYDVVAKRMALPRGSLGPTRKRCLDKLRVLLEERVSGGGAGSS